jgi:hypothetical protein
VPLSLTLALDGVRVVSFTPRPLYPRGSSHRYSRMKQWLWFPELIWTLWSKEKCIFLAGKQTLMVQPIAHHYTDWAIKALICSIQGVPRGKVTIMGRHIIGHSKQQTVYVRVLFRTVSEIEIFHSTIPKLFIKKRYCVLFLIKLNSVVLVRKRTIPTERPQLVGEVSANFASRVRTGRVARLYSVHCTVQWNSSISETFMNRTHVHIHLLLRMTDTTTSQNIYLSSWDPLYIKMYID